MSPVASTKRSACCISHLFHAAASTTPDKVAVIHASGFSEIARGFRCATATVLPPGCDDTGSVFPETTPSSRPPVYGGDECFSFSDILSSVENLSRRLRHILDGAHDPGVIIPCSGGIAL